MKSVLMSIQPKWCELIASGEKTFEVRKTRPKISPPFKVYIYCTKGSGDCLWRWNGIWYDTQFPNERPNRLDGKVIGEFTCERIDSYHRFMIDEIRNERAEKIVKDIESKACITLDYLKEYTSNLDRYDEFYVWHISDLKIYDKPRELSEFKRFCDGVGGKIGCRGCQYYYSENTESGSYEECLCDNLRPITRAFQSWGYVASEDTE